MDNKLFDLEIKKLYGMKDDLEDFTQWVKKSYELNYNETLKYFISHCIQYTKKISDDILLIKSWMNAEF